MTLKQINKLKPGRLRALTGMTFKALEEVLALVLPELAQRRAQAKQQRPDRQRALGGRSLTQARSGARSLTRLDLLAAQRRARSRRGDVLSQRRSQ